MPVPGAGSFYAYQMVTAPLASVTGQHDVYLVFTCPARPDTFSLRQRPYPGRCRRQPFC